MWCTMKNVIGLPRKKSCLMPINHGKWILELLSLSSSQRVISSEKITFLECQRCAIWSSITEIGDFTHTVGEVGSSLSVANKNGDHI